MKACKNCEHWERRYKSDKYGGCALAENGHAYGYDTNKYITVPPADGMISIAGSDDYWTFLLTGPDAYCNRFKEKDNE